MECLKTPPTGILTNTEVVILLLINSYSRLLPRVLTLALVSTSSAPCFPSLGSLVLFPSFFPRLFLPFPLSLRILDFLFSYAFCETSSSNDLSIIRPSTQIKVSSADLPCCVPLTPFSLPYSPLPSREKDGREFESVRDPSSLKKGETTSYNQKKMRRPIPKEFHGSLTFSNHRIPEYH